MRTVQYLIDELKKFNPNDLCFAYEGEETGIVIEHKPYGQSLIRCSEFIDYKNIYFGRLDLESIYELQRAEEDELKNQICKGSFNYGPDGYSGFIEKMREELKKKLKRKN